MARVKKKLVMVGDAGIGKTSLLIHYSTGHFPGFDNFLPISLDNHVVRVDQVNGKHVDLELWDPSQMNLDGGRRPVAYGDADIILACFSVDYEASLKHLVMMWLPLVQHYSSDAPIILLGTRVDLRNDNNESDAPFGKLVPVQAARVVAGEIGARAYLECSAKSGRGVAKVFQEAARLAMEHKKKRDGCTVC